MVTVKHYYDGLVWCLFASARQAFWHSQIGHCVRIGGAGPVVC